MNFEALRAGEARIEERLIRPPAEAAGLMPPGTDFEHFYSRYVCYRERMSFGTSDARSRCETFVVEPGLLMLVVDVGLTRPFEAKLQGQDIVEFHYRNSGSIALRGHWGQLDLREQSLLLWYQPPGCNDVEEVVGSRSEPRESWISLYCDRQWLHRNIGAEGLALPDVPIGTAADMPRAPVYRVYPQLGAARAVCGDILRNGIDGPLKYLYAKGKALDLLCATLRVLRASQPRSSEMNRLTARDRRNMCEVRAILDGEFVSPPDVPTLARRVGTNPAKLCFGFKAQFGETTSEFVRRRRMELAHELLTTTDVQVREVAWRVGYQHHSTFSAAFARHFGDTPKAVARNRRGAAD